MRKITISGLLICVCMWAGGACFADSCKAGKKAGDNPNLGKVRHVVLFQWKDGTPEAKVKEVENAFRALPSKVDAIADFEWGTDMSVEGLADGFTHAFLVTFNTKEDRAVYLPHPEHKKFVELIKPHLEKVLVVDYVAGK